MEYIMETRDLVKSYKNKTVVDTVSIHVKKGEIYGFVGPNGAGKSTVMKMLMNLTPQDSGEIYIFGEQNGGNNSYKNNNNNSKSINKGNSHSNNCPYEYLKRIGSIIESPYFYEKITGRENLQLHCEYMGYHNIERIDEVLRLVDLQDIEGKAVSRYSMGMKQRLAIARAILTKPELLILDEPINSLDPEGIREMRTLFRRLNQEYGTTIFISSHILSEVEQIADTIGIIQNGRLLKEASMSDIRKLQAEYIELEVDDIRRTSCLLEKELGLTNFKVVTDAGIEIYDVSKSVKEISTALVQNEIGIISIGMKQNSLEDYFFHVIKEG